MLRRTHRRKRRRANSPGHGPSTCFYPEGARVLRALFRGTRTLNRMRQASSTPWGMKPAKSWGAPVPAVARDLGEIFMSRGCVKALPGFMQLPQQGRRIRLVRGRLRPRDHPPDHFGLGNAPKGRETPHPPGGRLVERERAAMGHDCHTSISHQHFIPYHYTRSTPGTEFGCWEVNGRIDPQGRAWIVLWRTPSTGVPSDARRE